MLTTIQRSALGSTVAQTVENSLLDLHRRYRAILAEQAPFHDRSVALRADLVKRWGECRGKSRPAAVVWGHDPDYAELHSANRESDRLTSELTDVTYEMMETAATTRAGVFVKLQLAIDLWPRNEDGTDVHEQAAISAIRDALRLFGGAA